MSHPNTTEEAVPTLDEQLPQPAQLPQIDDFGEPLDLLIPIPIEDNGEPLVDVFEYAPEMHWMHESLRFEFERFGLGRLSLAKMLAKAQSYLPPNRSLVIVGVFRPFETQRAMYERVMQETREKNPNWSDEYLVQYINVFAAPPVRETPPPHTTGGAVDLGIVDERGERLDFVSPFEMGWESAPMMKEGLSPEARRNRDLLIDVLTSAGLTNFRGEWWHWSYGEPGWALRGGHRAALYGAVPDDQIPAWTAPPKKGN